MWNIAFENTVWPHWRTDSVCQPGAWQPALGGRQSRPVYPGFFPGLTDRPDWAGKPLGSSPFVHTASALDRQQSKEATGALSGEGSQAVGRWAVLGAILLQ